MASYTPSGDEVADRKFEELNNALVTARREVDAIREQQVVTRAILRVIHSSPSDPQAVFDAIVHQAAKLCEAEFSAVARFENGLLHLVAVNELTPEEEAAFKSLFPRAPGRQCVIGRTFIEGQPVQIEDVFVDREYDPRTLEVFQQAARYRTFLGIPIVCEEKTIGVIGFGRREVRAFTDRQIDLLQTFAEQAAIAIENARLFEQAQASTKELQQSIEYQTATSEVLGIVSRSPTEVRPVLEKIAATASVLCQADHATIFRIRDGFCYLEASEASEDFVRYLKENPIPLDGNTVTARAAHSRKVLHLPDTTEGEDFDRTVVQRSAARTLLAVPLLLSDAAIGVITIARNEILPFTPREIELITTFADQAVIAIENARLFETEEETTKELQESLEYQTAISEVLSVISRSPHDLQPVLDVIVATSVQLCRSTFGHVRLLHEDGAYHIAAHKIDDPELVALMRDNPFRPGQDSVAGRTVLAGRTVHVTDVAADPLVSGFQKQISDKVRTAMSVPLKRKDKVIGLISVFHDYVRPFTDRQIKLVETFADQAVIAIENARLFDETNKALERQTATAEILKVIASSPSDVQPVFDVIVRTAAQLCRAEFSFIAKVVNGKLHLAAGNRMDAEHLQYFSRRPVSIDRTSITGRVAATRRSVHVADVLADPEFTHVEWQKVGHQRTVLGVPLLKEGTLIGVLVLARKEVAAFDENQIALVETFADQAVIAIENARLFEAEQNRTRELQDSLEYQTATSEVLGVISRSPTELQPVLDTIVSAGARLCEAEFAILFGVDGAACPVMASSNATDEFIQALSHNPVRVSRGSTTGRAVIERKTINVEDVLAWREYERHDTQRKGNHRSTLSVPLLRQGEPVGVLTLLRSSVRVFNERQVKLAETFADQAVIAIQNTHLFEAEQERSKELRESLEYQIATSDVLESIANSATDNQPVFDTIVTNAARLCGAKFSTIVLSDGKMLHLAALNNSNDSAAAVQHNNYPMILDRSQVASRAFLDREVVQITDVLKDPDYSQKLASAGGCRSLMGVPLMRQGQAIGAIGVAKSEPLPYSQQQVDLISTFARQAVIAIENARLFDAVQDRQKELAKSVQELQSLSEVGQVVSSSLDMTEVLQTILENATRMAEASSGTVYDYDKSTQEFLLTASLNMSADHTARVRRQPLRLEDPVVGECAQQRQAIQIEDLRREDLERSPLFEILVRAGVRSIMAVPLLRQDEVVGALVIRRNYASTFSPETVRLLEAFAVQSAIAVSNARLFKEVEEAGQALAVASEHKSQFLANMSHELRTPLNAILGYTELIQDGIYGVPEKKVSDVLGRVQSNGKHLLGLINDVLDLSKIEAGQVELTRDGYSLSDAIQTVIEATESLATEKNLELRTEVAQSLPAGLGDERRLVQVLLNLVGNAIKFTDEGRVTISASHCDDRFNIAVTDTGPGIPEDELARIFEEFHQVDSSATKRKGGTGLGLAISQRIVELHGGELTVTSKVGVGSTFNVELPVRLGKQ